MVELEHFTSISHEAIRQVLKNELKPCLKKQWCIPPKASAEFVAAMEDVLETYQQPKDACNPVVCVDEQVNNISKKLDNIYLLLKVHHNDMIMNTNAMALAICL